MADGRLRDTQRPEGALRGIATLLEVLGTVADPDAAVRRLVKLANEAGGPDNVSCVVADIAAA